MERPMTVKELLKECEEQIRRGNGDKNIYISSDDEGNGYHGLYYTFTDDTHIIEDCDWNDDIQDKPNAVILG